MPDTQLSNPQAEESENWFSNQQIEEYLYPSSASGNLTNGMVVISAAVSSTTTPALAKATTTAAFTNLGVVVNAPTGGYAPGSVVQVAVGGFAQVLCDANN